MNTKRIAWTMAMMTTLSALPAHGGGASITAFTYQGQLRQNGAPLDGLVDLEFRLFTTAEGDSQVGTTRTAFDVGVVNGLFTAEVDFGPGAFDDTDRFLEIAVASPAGSGTFTPLNPRQPITAVPYAIKVRGIDGHSLDAADRFPTDAVFVDNAGNVGIGTLAPLNRLHVTSAAPADGIRLAGTTGNDPGYHLYHGSIQRGSIGLALQTGSWSTDAAPGDVVLRSNTGKLLLQNGFLQSALAINNNNIGVGTANPTAKLDVRGDIRLGPIGQFRATSGEENLRIVRGVVALNGTIITGSGFTVSNQGPGDYLITFTTPFAGPPALTVSHEFTAPNPGINVIAFWPMADNVSANSANVVIVRYISSSDEFVLQSSPFHFIAVGPR